MKTNVTHYDLWTVGWKNNNVQQASIYKMDGHILVDEVGNRINNFIGFQSTLTMSLVIAHSTSDF
jgi:hypothetical protein